MAQEAADLNGLTDEIRRLLIGDDHGQTSEAAPSATRGRTHNNKDVIRIKYKYMEDTGLINVDRPASFSSLQAYFERLFRRRLNMYYTTSSKELVMQIRDQTELEKVIELHERNNNRRPMRLILSKRKDQSQFNLAPQAMFRGISDAASETSSMVSASTASFGSARMPTTEAGLLRLATPVAPTNWRESRCLGRGSFGHVYVCLNVDTNEQLVVKKIYFGHNARQRSRVLSALENEVNMLSTLRHPHIVQYHGCAQLSDCFCIFMEFMTGGTLKDQIREMGALSEGFAVDFTGQILSGLAYLHSMDIIHRDIKCANILRDTRALVKIADFGSATYLQQICSRSGVDIHGTPHYTAPEIILNSHRYNKLSDIWSLGICMVEMLTTRTPWDHVDPAHVHLKIAYEPLPLDLPPHTSPELEACLKSMLEPDLERRPSAECLLARAPFSCVR